MRQIQMLVQFIVSIILNKASALSEISEQTGEVGELYTQLKESLATGDICTAEDTLYSHFREGHDYLQLAVWFYNELNNMHDDALEAANFSREEIFQGLQDILYRNGISLPLIT